MEAKLLKFGATVSSLLNNCLESIARNVILHEKYFDRVPTDIKKKIIKKLSMRGVLTSCHLQKLLHTSVETLNLSGCNISDEGLYVISDYCAELRKLDLNAEREARTNITTRGVVKVATRCIHLHTVFLRRCVNIKDDAIVALATCCRYLTNLNLGGCRHVTDRALIAMAENCCNLESLNVSHTQVTDNGLIALSCGESQQSMKEVHFAYCIGVTDRAVVNLAERCLKITILIFHGCPRTTGMSRDVLETLLIRGSKQLSWTVY